MQDNVIPLNTKRKPTYLQEVGKQMLTESKFFSGYSRWLDDAERYETWSEAVSRVMGMHRQKYAKVMTPALSERIDFAERHYMSQSVLGAQRALQFGGPQIFQHEARLYNCSSSHVDRPEFFQEAMYLLLCGCGVGFSVQRHHIAQLPKVATRSSEVSRIFMVPDTIEGWSDAFGVLLSSYLTKDAPFPEYQGSHVTFDFSLVRPKGAFISGGFKAPGPEGLRQALIKCEALMDKLVRESHTIRPIIAYDFVMHMADAVLSGGVRRSATICLFSKDDPEMMKAKTGDWFVENPQRGRSNNSVVLLRNELTREEWAGIMKSVKDYGEPGFILTDNLEFCYNPCVEIGMWPKTADGRSGFQMCNLTEINGGKCNTAQDFYEACEAAAILGTLQAGYTNFTYLSGATREIVEREALIGVSVTGWMNNPGVLFSAFNMKTGANIVKVTNKAVAKLIGINPAARTTCVKPSGNASVLLGTASGIHGEHSPRYFRNVQMNESDGALALIQERNPDMVEDSVWSANGTDKVVSFPVISKEGSIYKSDLLGVKQLEYVKAAQQGWVEHGTNEDLCTDSRLRHNVSNTITVDDWDEVEQYIYDNREWFAGISLLATSGDKAYVQAPFTEVLTAQEIVDQYGEASMFASGLIVDGLYAFNDNLWQACDTAMGFGLKLHASHSKDLMKRDWVRRAEQFAQNYFMAPEVAAYRDTGKNTPEDVEWAVKYLEGMQRMVACLKDCFNLHKWKTIERQIQPINFTQELGKQEYTEINTMGAQACAGGACEVTF